MSDINALLEGMDTSAKLALLKSLQEEKKTLNDSMRESKQELAEVLWSAASSQLQEYFDGPIGSYSFNAKLTHPETGEEQKVQFIVRPAKKRAAKSNGSDQEATTEE